MLILCAAASLGLLLVQTAAAEPSTALPHSLFLIDTSLPMARHKTTIGQVLATRLQRSPDLRTGDVCALWTFDENVSTNRYRPGVWNSSARELAGRFLASQWNEQSFQGESRLDRVLRQTASLTAGAAALTIHLITDGGNPLLGTPFDPIINATLRQAVLAQGPGGDPFVVTLLIRESRPVAWSIETATGEQILAASDAPEFSSPPRLNRDLKPSLVREASRGRPPTPPIQPEPRVEPSRAEPPSSLKTNDSQAIAPPPISPEVTTNSPLATAPGATLDPTPIAAPKPSLETPPEPKASSAEQLAPPRPLPIPTKSGSGLTSPAATPPLPAITNHQEVATKKADPRAPTGPSPQFYLGLGLFLAIAAALGLVYGRRPNPTLAQPSLISQSLKGSRGPELHSRGEVQKGPPAPEPAPVRDQTP